MTLYYLNDTSLWVSESAPLRLWDKLAFVFALLIKTVNSLFKILKLEVLQKTQKTSSIKFTLILTNAEGSSDSGHPN